MKGGSKGLLENSTNLCKTKNRAAVAFTAHSGKQADSTSLLTPSCAKGKKHGKRHGRGGR